MKEASGAMMALGGTLFLGGIGHAQKDGEDLRGVAAMLFGIVLVALGLLVGVQP